MKRVRQSLVAISIALASVLLGPAAALALPITPTFNWRSASPGSDPDLWEANIGSHQWSLSGPTQTTPPTSYPGITAAFDFASGQTATGTSFQTIVGGNPSNEDVSLELWFRADDLLAGGQQVLFETGGNRDGLSLLLDDNLLTFRVKDNGTVVERTHSLDALSTEFFQVAITLDLDNLATLYVDGAISGSAVSASGLDDWTNNNGAGLGTVSGQIGGNDGGDLDGYGDFVGEISIMRFYRNQVLSAAQVQQNFDAIATPEPGTGVLVALGLVGLSARRRLLRSHR